MTTLDLLDFADERPRYNAVFGRLLALLAPARRWVDRRRTLAALSHLDAHLLDDVGIEPSDYRLDNRHPSAAWTTTHIRPNTL